MPPVSPQTVQITCPNCRNVYQTNVYYVIDVTQQPALKDMLLSGQVNVTVCPTCGLSSMLGMPLAYHDAEKHLFFVCIPQEIQMGTEEQERFIGETTNAIVQSLSAESSRGYLFTPRRFISLTSMIDAILEADGVPREVLEQQRNRVQLISELAEAAGNEEQFNRLIEQNKDQLTHEFFATLAMFIEASNQQGQTESAQLLTNLLEKLSALTGLEWGNLDEDAPDTEALLEQLEQATDEELEDIVADIRPHIDYAFFQTWTNRIESVEQAGQQDVAKQLYNRRSQVLDIVERVDKEAQAIFESSSALLREVLDAPDTKTILEEQSDKLNEAFMMVVSANIEAAHRAGQEDLAAKLEEITMLAVEIIQAKLPPEERLINELLMAETAQESSTILRQNGTLITTDFVKKLNELAEEQEKRGLKDNVSRLRQLAREASAMLF